MKLVRPTHGFLLIFRHYCYVVSRMSVSLCFPSLLQRVIKLARVTERSRLRKFLGREVEMFPFSIFSRMFIIY